MNKLTLRRSNLSVLEREVPMVRSGKGELTKTLYIIPVTRQYILNTADNMIEVRRMFTVNMKLYK